MHVFRESPPQRQNSSEDCHRSFHAKRSIASSQLTNCTQFFSRLASRSPPTRVSAYRNRPTGAYTGCPAHRVVDEHFYLMRRRTLRVHVAEGLLAPCPPLAVAVELAHGAMDNSIPIAKGLDCFG
jgi:hypothetical protein